MSKMAESGISRILLNFEPLRRVESTICELDRLKTRPTALAPRFDYLICNNMIIGWELQKKDDY